MNKWILSVLLILCTTVHIWAADVPKTISYSGKYVHADGSPMPDGVYDLLFSLYETQTGGTPVWQELHRQADKNGVVVNKGSFAVVLGNQTPLPLFDKNYYVAMSSPQTGQEVASRGTLGSSPYAINAFNGVPVGTILAWHPNIVDPLLEMPEGFERCDGQTVTITSGPLKGEQVMPNLNGNQANPGIEVEGGGTTKAAMFLRGGMFSGKGQKDALQNHYHNVEFCNSNFSSNAIPEGGQYAKYAQPSSAPQGCNVDTETRPVNMSVVWIMKVK